jgi:glycosyltransferase involved in cell wall biosynthesis
MTDATDDEPLKVLLLAEDFYPKDSGGAFKDWSTAKHLADAGDHVTVVTPHVKGASKRETVEGIEIHRPFQGTSANVHPNSVGGQFWRIRFVVLVLFYLINLFRRENFDLVYSTNHLMHPLAAFMSVIFRRPHVTYVGYSPSIRDDVSLSDPLILIERLNFQLFMGDRSLCQTPSVYKRLSRISNAKIKRIDGSVDADAVRSAINSESDQNLRVDKNRVEMIFVGRLVEIKSPAKIPSIVAQLPPVYSLRMIGDGPQRPAVENAIREANVGTRVDIAGRLSHEQTLRAIHDADLLLLPSKADAYPAVVFEALSLNTPVLGTPVGILPSLDHPLLKTTKLENFRRIILEHDWTSKNGINEQDLDRFSVTRFSNEVRSELLNAVCDT